MDFSCVPKMLICGCRRFPGRCHPPGPSAREPEAQGLPGEAKEGTCIGAGPGLLWRKLCEAWDDLVDSFCVLAVEDIQQAEFREHCWEVLGGHKEVALGQVYAWRQQAETEMKQTQGPCVARGAWL